MTWRIFADWHCPLLIIHHGDVEAIINRCIRGAARAAGDYGFKMAYIRRRQSITIAAYAGAEWRIETRALPCS